MIDVGSFNNTFHSLRERCYICLRSPRSNKVLRCCFSKLRCYNCPGSLLEHDKAMLKCLYGSKQFSFLWSEPTFPMENQALDWLIYEFRYEVPYP